MLDMTFSKKKGDKIHTLEAGGTLWVQSGIDCRSSVLVARTVINGWFGSKNIQWKTAPSVAWCFQASVTGAQPNTPLTPSLHLPLVRFNLNIFTEIQTREGVNDRAKALRCFSSAF